MIYLDNNATTRPAPEVLEAMWPYYTEHYGNAASTHLMGQRAAVAVEEARAQVARLIGAREREIVFTSGGTESIHAAIRGILPFRPRCRRIVISAVEHEAVIRLAEQLEEEGYQITRIAVDSLGHLDLQMLAESLGDDVAIAAIMHANNETGVIFPIEEVARLTDAAGVPLLVDMTQTVGKIPIDVASLPVQMAAFSAHKFHGPKGVGALYVRSGVHLRPLLVGGGQERNRRSGTTNVPGIVGMGAAADVAARDMEAAEPRIRELRDRLENAILQRVPNCAVIGDRDQRLANTTMIGFEALESEGILLLLSEHGICASGGSACASGSLEASHVLRAMGIPERLAHGAVRFSLSRYTTAEEIDMAIEKLPGLIARLAELNLATERKVR